MADTIEAKLTKKYFGNVVDGPRGLRMPEATARAIEAVAKTLPQTDEFAYRRKAKAAVEMRMEPGERADVSFITTDAVDREGEVVLPKGGKWTDYNRVVTWCHSYGPQDGYNGLPVGTNLWIKPAETSKGMGLLGKTRYHTKPEGWAGDWMPDAVLHLMQQDPPACTGKSIGFIPLNIRQASKKEIEANPDYADAPVIDKWIGFEYAACPVPMNQEAEMETVSKCVADLGTRAIIAKALGVTVKVPVVEEVVQEVIAPALPFVRVATIQAAIKRAVDEQKRNVPALVVKCMRDELDRAMGRV
jgi:hypothetical protein